MAKKGGCRKSGTKKVAAVGIVGKTNQKEERIGKEILSWRENERRVKFERGRDSEKERRGEDIGEAVERVRRVSMVV